MSQSVKIFVFLCIAFLVYITSKGELPNYMKFFNIGTGSSRLEGEEALASYGTASNPSVSQQITSTEGKISTGVQAAETLAQTITSAQTTAETAETEKASDEISSGLYAIAGSQLL